MRRPTIILLLSSILLCSVSCKKSTSGDKVTYEVLSSNGTWSGDYFDYSNNSQSLKMVNGLPDGWKFSFTVGKGQKAGLVLSAIPDNTGAVTANIYINGKLAASDSGEYGATAQIILNQ